MGMSGQISYDKFNKKYNYICIYGDDGDYDYYCVYVY